MPESDTDSPVGKMKREDWVSRKGTRTKPRTVMHGHSLCSAGAFAFLFGLRPPGLCRFAGKFLSLLWRERCHACFSTFAAGCLPALSAHLSHHFGNQVASHIFIL